MNSQEGLSVGGATRSLSLLIMLEIRHALFIFVFFLADSSVMSEEHTWSVV